uniref:Uncharacterized protein n=1 Tax=Chenopodium quinoa TaxID=63459 RepID=A0A803MHY8_CHEQI
MGCEQLVIRFLKKKCHWRPSSVPNVLVPNINLLRSYGISMESIRKFLVRAPAPFFRNIEFLENAVIKVKEELGISPQSPQFLSVVMLLSSVNENTMELKREMFRSFGWTESDISTLLASSPFAFGLSEATIKKKLDFLMNQLGYEPSYLSKRYNLLTCSLEKRILPRHKTLIVLKEKGFIKMDYLLESSVSLTESQFLKKFVLPYKEVHGVYSQHAGITSVCKNLIYVGGDMHEAVPPAQAVLLKLMLVAAVEPWSKDMAIAQLFRELSEYSMIAGMIKEALLSLTIEIISAAPLESHADSLMSTTVAAAFLVTFRIILLLTLPSSSSNFITCSPPSLLVGGLSILAHSRSLNGSATS